MKFSIKTKIQLFILFIKNPKQYIKIKKSRKYLY